VWHLLLDFPTWAAWCLREVPAHVEEGISAAERRSAARSGPSFASPAAACLLALLFSGGNGSRCEAMADLILGGDEVDAQQRDSFIERMVRCERLVGEY
jgi:hypothetical protein